MTDKLHIIHLKNTPILDQLKLEEALLRTDDRNFCILNEGSTKAIVMGISGKEAELVDIEKTRKAGIPVIKRFSGGGTVIVDADTFFVSFLFRKDRFSFPAFPERILNWSEDFYKGALNLEGFALKENDYIIGNLKCGGNAQYIKKDRFIHHTTFLWDFDEENMKYLLHPKKTPKYREERSHLDFLCTMKEHIPSHAAFADLIKLELGKEHELIEVSYEDVLESLERPHRKTTTVIPL
ncbi:MAG: hypothetical protein S4CHLAM37_01400 [Chlamydiia bacterium]|nr:hypothetical protein [Chlamydiia bacterium]